MGAILHQSPESPSNRNALVPARLEEIIFKALEKDPGVRYQHAADLRADLKRLKRDLDSGTLRSAPADSRARAGPRMLQFRWIVALSITLVLAIVVWSLNSSLPGPSVTRTDQITSDAAPKGPPLLTDGSRIYFQSNGAWDAGIRQVSIRGGDSVVFSTPLKQAALQDISPDHSELLLGQSSGPGAPQELWVTATPGGSPRRLGNLVCSYRNPCAGWSPDGEQIVYAADKELYRARRDGTEIRKLATVEGTPFWPRWSPDGRTIRFSVIDMKGKSNLWEVSADGADSHPLLPRWGKDDGVCCGAWTPNGKYFVFRSFDFVSTSDVWALREASALFRVAPAHVFRLTTGAMQYGPPIPSMDGRRLFVEGYQPATELLRFDLKSGQFTPLLGGMSAGLLEYSRDGKWVTYVTYADNALWRSASDGSQRVQLVSPPLVAWIPRFSSDGKQIAFVGYLPGSDIRRIYVVSSEGGVPEAVTAGKGPGGDWDPTWSPDGNLIAFGNTPFVDAPPHSKMIHVLDTKSHRFSDLPGSEGMCSPVWSPDGRFIAGLSARGYKLMIYDVASHRQADLVAMRCGFAHWSPDGQFLYFVTYGEDRAWWRVRIKDKKLEQVRRLKDVRMPPDMGNWFSVSPDNGLVTARDVSTDQIYALDWDAP